LQAPATLLYSQQPIVGQLLLQCARTLEDHWPDATERDALRSLLPQVENWLVYVDGTDEALEGTWKTQTGETIQSVPFQGPPGSVDTFPIGGTDRNCLHMSFNQFVDAFCVSTNGGALCEINL